MLVILQDRQFRSACCGFFAPFVIFCSNPRLKSASPAAFGRSQDPVGG
jgi:hypothetical protein